MKSYLYLSEYSLLLIATCRPFPDSNLSSFKSFTKENTAFLTAGFHGIEVGVSSNFLVKILDSGFSSGIITFVASISGSLSTLKYNKTVNCKIIYHGSHQFQKKMLKFSCILFKRSIEIKK